MGDARSLFGVTWNLILPAHIRHDIIILLRIIEGPVWCLSPYRGDPRHGGGRRRGGTEERKGGTEGGHGRGARGTGPRDKRASKIRAF